METEAGKTAKAKLRDCLSEIADARVPQSIADQAGDLAENLLGASDATVEGIRAIVDKCHVKKATGLYKIFTALGKPLIQSACVELKSSSTDSTLAQPLQTVIDLSVVLESAEVSGVVVTRAEECAYALFKIVSTASRTFRDNNREQLDRGLNALIKCAGSMATACFQRLDLCINQMLHDVESEDFNAITVHIVTTYEGSDKVGQEEQDTAAKFAESMCLTLLKTLELNKVGTNEDLTAARKATTELQNFSKECGAWEVVLSAIANSTLQPRERSEKIAPALCHFNEVGYRWSSHEQFLKQQLQPVPRGRNQLGGCLQIIFYSKSDIRQLT